MFPEQDHESAFFQMSFRLTSSPREMRRSNLSKHEINRYVHILHDSSLVVSFSNISAFFA